MELSPNFYPITEEGFELTQARDNTAVFVLYRKQGVQKIAIHVGSADHLADGVKKSQQIVPMATHFKFHLETKSTLQQSERELKKELKL